MNRKALGSRVLLSLSAVYMVLVVACITALFLIPVFPTFMDGDRMASGCYITEAFLAGASCHGFWGSDLAGTLLQLPFVLVLGPIFGLGALASGDLAATARGATTRIFHSEPMYKLYIKLVHLPHAPEAHARKINDLAAIGFDHPNPSPSASFLVSWHNQRGHVRGSSCGATI